MSSQLKIIARPDWDYRSIGLHILRYTGEVTAVPGTSHAAPTREYVNGFTVEPIEHNQNYLRDASAHLELEDAQELMDQLYACGIRPSEAAGSAGQLAATERHLNDMRAIVGKQLEVGLK